MTPLQPALVIGGGPAGAAAALRLVRGGRRVLLLERETGPHDKVCGEFISWEALAELDLLGMDVWRLGAQPIRRVSLSCGARTAQADLPAVAASLSRRVLDEALLAAAEAAGVEVRRGCKALSLDRHGAGWRADLAGAPSISAADVFLAVGKHELRGWKRGPALQEDLVGFKMHWRLAQAQARALSGRVEIGLFPSGYAGLEPIEDGLANLCLLIRRRSLQALGGWPEVLNHVLGASPALAERLAGGRPAWDRPLAAAALPYGFVAAPGTPLWRVGDQAAVIPSFAGEGMAIALRSGRLAAESLLDGATQADFQAAFGKAVRGRVRNAARLSRAMVTPSLQPWIAGVAGVAPKLLALAATATRVPRNIDGSASVQP